MKEKHICIIVKAELPKAKGHLSFLSLKPIHSALQDVLLFDLFCFSSHTLPSLFSGSILQMSQLPPLEACIHPHRHTLAHAHTYTSLRTIIGSSRHLTPGTLNPDPALLCACPKSNTIWAPCGGCHKTTALSEPRVLPAPEPGTHL